MDSPTNKYPIIHIVTTALAQAPAQKYALEKLVVRALGETAIQRFGEGEQGEAAFHLTVHLGKKAVKYGGKAAHYVHNQLPPPLQTPLETMGRTVQDRLDELLGKKDY
ncbi:MAG: hypothetical protein Q7R96_05015 [Nanoarchaeota archaeon]|nr:hypothetical protein [Nanoarchaeota archaeon]